MLITRSLVLFAVGVLSLSHAAWGEDAKVPNAPKRLEADGSITWDNTGQQGDNIRVTLKPDKDDVGFHKMLVVGVFLEGRPPGQEQWALVSCTAAGAQRGHRSPLGQAYAQAHFRPMDVKPIKISLQIPSIAYALPGGQQELRYRVQTLRQAPPADGSGPPQIELIDNFVIPKTITASFNVTGPADPPFLFRGKAITVKTEDENFTLAAAAK